jgi:hypothetical protein
LPAAALDSNSGPAKSSTNAARPLSSRRSAPKDAIEDSSSCAGVPVSPLRADSSSRSAASGSIRRVGTRQVVGGPSAAAAASPRAARAARSSGEHAGPRSFRVPGSWRARQRRARRGRSGPAGGLKALRWVVRSYPPIAIPAVQRGRAAQAGPPRPRGFPGVGVALISRSRGGTVVGLSRFRLLPRHDPRRLSRALLYERGAELYSNAHGDDEHQRCARELA